MSKYVYFFGGGKADGRTDMKDPPRRQGRQPRRDDQHRPARAGRLHPHHRSLHLLLQERPQIPARAARPGGRRPAARREDHGREVRRRRQPAAAVLPLRRPRIHAGHDGHRPEHRPQRHDRQGPGQADRQRALRPRLLPPPAADVRRGRHGPQGPPRRAVRAHPQRREEVQGRQARQRTGRRRPQDGDRALQGGHPQVHRQGLPRKPDGPDLERRRRRVRLVDERPGHGLPPAVRHPRRVGHGLQRHGDGVRQPRRRLRHGRGPDARRRPGHAGHVRRLPHQRPGRGRGQRLAAHQAHRGDAGQGHAGGVQGTGRGGAQARKALPQHAGHRVHHPAQQALHAPDAQRQAAPASPPCAWPWTWWRKASSPRTRRFRPNSSRPAT